MKFLPTLIIIGAILSFSLQEASATTYVASGTGNFNSEKIWQPEYPGNVLSETDTVLITGNVTLNTDVIVKGFMMIGKQATLSGAKNIIVLDKGLMVNRGITLISGVTNRGTVLNKHILETDKDMINTGKLVNYESMVVGNILDNTGIITGNGGQLIANNRFVNSKTGSIEGSVDVCSNNFMNVDGGRIDSTNMSFCGNRIFNSVFLTANLKKESVVLNLLNSENKRFKKYDIERSGDGENFVTIASLTSQDIKDVTKSFRFTDSESVDTKSVYYRIRLTKMDGSEKLIPAVEVGNIYAKK